VSVVAEEVEVAEREVNFICPKAEIPIFDYWYVSTYES
jgi:hypothetical protein